MERVVPVLQIDDYQQACDFYVKGLGFNIEFEHRHEPGFPVFMGIRKGDLYFHLSEHGKGHVGTEVYVFVDDIQAWYERCQANGIATETPPEPKPWGNTDMPLKDPFRNLLRFSQTGTHEGQNTPNKDA